MNDYSFAGAGTVPGGEYGRVSVSGSGKGTGDIRCESFSASGSFSGNCSIYCSGNLKASGAFKCEGEIKAGCVGASGAFKCGKSLKAEKVKLSGALSIENDLEGDEVYISGSLNCGGLVNAENFELSHDGSSKIGSIGGSIIKIRRGSSTAGVLNKLFGIGKLGCVTVNEAIEGDVIELEYVNARKVTGRIVKIGPGCNIGTVTYSENVDISPEATVENCEQEQLLLP